MFLVVEFCSSGDTVVIPDSWTTEQRRSAWWPPYQSAARLSNAVRVREVPGQGWGTAPIRTLHQADSYNQARRKLSQIEHETPEPQPSDAVTLRRSKRRKRAPSRYTDTQGLKEDQPQTKRRRKGLNRPSTDAREPPPTRKPPARPLPPPPARRPRRAPPPPPTVPLPLPVPPDSPQAGPARRMLSSARGSRILTILKEILAEQRSIRRMIEFIMMHEGIVYEEETVMPREE